ncbi:MAG: DUF2878 family protein, partial [Myxococcota bacterium]
MSLPPLRFPSGSLPTALLFQGAWWATVGLAAQGAHWGAALPMLLFGSVVVAAAAGRGRLVGLIVSAVALGLLVELLLLQVGVVRFPLATHSLPPPWLLSLWMGFGA